DTAPRPGRTMPAEPPFDAGERFTDPDWLALDFGELQKMVQSQRDRQPRIRVPVWEDVAKLIPPKNTPPRPLRIKWSLVCIGYQPQLAFGWSACTRSFGQEAKQ